jgi:hypothetical protein
LKPVHLMARVNEFDIFGYTLPKETSNTEKVLYILSKISSAFRGHSISSESARKLFAFTQETNPNLDRSKLALFIRLKKAGSSFKKPTTQQIFNSRVAKQKWLLRNKSTILKRNMFIEKAKKHMNLVSALHVVSSSYRKF